MSDPFELPQGDVVSQVDDVVVRRMRDEDEDYRRIAEWRNLPHVRRWWDPDLPPPTPDGVKKELQPDTAPGGSSVACIIEQAGEPVGYFQFYRWASYVDDAVEVGIPFDDSTFGLDIFIGEPESVGRGLGTRVVDMMSSYFLQEAGASSVALTTDIGNQSAQRCYEKAGFEKIREVLDTDTYQGERARCWLMVRSR